MHPRIDNPALTVPGALKALQGIANAARQADIPETTLYLVELRASQINGCGVCVDIHSRELKHAGEPDERINTVAVWRDVSYFTEAEQAALALTEAATRLADRPDPVPDDVWDDAARHYDGAQLARARGRDRRDQHLESSQRHHEAARRSLGRRVARAKLGRTARQPDPSSSTASVVGCGERRRCAPLAIAFTYRIGGAICVCSCRRVRLGLWP